MAHNSSWSPKTAAPAMKNQLVLAVGRRAWLQLPPTGAASGDFVPFGVKPGTPHGHELMDGQEVEIISWRPSDPHGLCYQIQRRSDRREWWTRSTCLRTSATQGAA